MALSNNVLNVTGLDFTTIRNNLETYISSQSDFTDYDFEGSTISNLLDLLAYNTYYNSIYTNMASNEMFLDSAQIRANVVSRAKMLGYTPSSARGASAIVQVNVTPRNTQTDTITVAKNTQFTATVEGIDYSFVTPQAYTINKVGTSTVLSANITITEGEPLTHRFTVGSANTRYILPNENIDLTSLAVSVQTSASNTTVITHTKADDISSVFANSTVYFCQETEEQEYELIFGNGVIGKALTTGNIIIADYRVCNGEKLNGAAVFTAPANIGGETNFTFSTTEAAIAGANPESIDGIKFNAPKNYQTQNRAVATSDYERIIVRDFPDIKSLRVWGGENNDPPTYGKVYIAAKPETSLYLSQQRKTVIGDRLRKYNVVGFETVFVDATYLYINPTIEVRWNSDDTVLTGQQLRENVSTTVTNFESSNLGQFNNTRFRISKFQRFIDDTDASIFGNQTSIRIEKRFTPLLDRPYTYTLNFNNAFDLRHPHPMDGIYGVVESSSFGFVSEGVTYNAFFDDDGEGDIQIYYTEGNNRIYLNKKAGRINYDEGIITLDNFLPISYVGSFISISVDPRKTDIKASTNELMLFGQAKVTMVDETTSTILGATAIDTEGTGLSTGSSEIGGTIFSTTTTTSSTGSTTTSSSGGGGGGGY